MPKRPTPYVPRGTHTLDDIDWNDPGIRADILRVFDVLAEIEPTPTTPQEQSEKGDTEEGTQASTEAQNDEQPASENTTEEARKPL